MKRTIHLWALFILVVACNQHKPKQVAEISEDSVSSSDTEQVRQESVLIEYDPIDAQTFGYKGKVKEVLTNSYLSRDENGNLIEGDLLNQTVITFDERGHVTCDSFGNVYEYDANAEFYRGNHTYTTIKRDKDGRVKEYIDKNPNSDSESDKSYTFTFDEVGRIISIVHTGFDGYWGKKCQYDGGNLYPSVTSEMYYEEDGNEITTSTSYRYSHFDQKGNWTERIGVCSETQKDLNDSTTDKTVRINDRIIIEKQAITYYD